MTHSVLRIAHRGNTRDFPENTLLAFHSALDLGADGIELDIHLGKQNQILVVHNYTFDPSLDYPQLDEVLAELGQRGRIEIEIKELDLTLLPILRQTLEKHQLSNYELTTSVMPLVHHIRQEFSKARIGLIFRRWLIEEWMPPEFRLRWLSKHLELSGANVLHLDLDLYTPELAEGLKKQGFSLHSHLKTANKDDWEKLKVLGIDQCTFDDPELLNY